LIAQHHLLTDSLRRTNVWPKVTSPRTVTWDKKITRFKSWLIAINTVLLIVVPGVALAWAEPQNFYGPNGQYQQGSASAAKPSAAS
jgi:hypothetical protein